MMNKILYALLLACMASFSLPLQAQQENVNLLYIANNEPPIGGDAILINSLDSLGYNVTALVASAYNEFSHLDFSADVIVFGESLGSGAVVPFRNAGFPVPCVSLEGYCVRENRWALVTTNADFGQILPAASLPEIVSDPEKHFGIKIINDHPIAQYAGLSAGDEVDWSSQRDSSAEVTYFTLPQAAATVVADIKGETDRHTLYAIHPDENDETNPLEHRLVIWGVHEWGLLQPNAIFFDLLDGAILWTLGFNNTRLDAAQVGVPLRAYPNPILDQSRIEFSLTAPATVTLDIQDLTGRTVAQETAHFSAGPQTFTFQRPAQLSRGTYLFRLSAGVQVLGHGKLIAQ